MNSSLGIKVLPVFSLIFGSSASTVTPAVVSPVLAATRGDYTVEDAYAYCARLAHARHCELAAATRYMSERQRRHMLAVYAFACTADDFADEPQYAGKRKAALDQWEVELFRAFHEEADHPVFIALRDTVDSLDIPITPFIKLLTAFRMSLVLPRYATFAELLCYSEHRSQPIGQLVLYLYKYQQPQLHELADELCVGLHLVALLQGLVRRPVRDRCGIPLADLRHFGLTEESLRHGLNEPIARAPAAAVRDLIRYQVARARAYLERGRPLLELVQGPLDIELALLWHTGQLMLHRLEDSILVNPAERVKQIVFE